GDEVSHGLYWTGQSRVRSDALVPPTPSSLNIQAELARDTGTSVFDLKPRCLYREQAQLPQGWRSKLDDCGNFIGAGSTLLFPQPLIKAYSCLLPGGWQIDSLTLIRAVLLTQRGLAEDAKLCGS
ncbi:hypothetical protein, partial [Pseudomonas quasicaspiana]|uniref:hypothetical protein n=1 Tax=Pseudomonas quasicaspiana TaxID=2829821 RepID=UPI001E559C36